MPHAFLPEFLDKHALPCVPAAPVAVAVSGGADSIAALRVLCEMRDTYARPLSITVLHYHHGLREASDQEYLFVKHTAARLNCELIAENAGNTVKHAPGNTQQNARNARYDFFKRACARTGIRYIITGHHLNDQAETIIMRLTAGAGSEGLSGMRDARDVGDGVILLRPFLSVPRTTLHTALHHSGDLDASMFCHDKSNDDKKYSRTRIRAFLDKEPEAATRHIATSAHALCADNDYIRKHVSEAIKQHITFSRAGHILIRESLWILHPALLHRILSALHAHCGGKTRIRAEKLQYHIKKALFAINTSSSAPHAFGGYVWRYLPDKQIFHLYRDSARCEKAAFTASKTPTIWDNRFRIHIPPDTAEGVILSLKTALHTTDSALSLSTVRKELPFPFYVTDALPVLRRLDNRIILPHIFYADKKRAHTCLPDTPAMACVALKPDLCK